MVVVDDEVVHYHARSDALAIGTLASQRQLAGVVVEQAGNSICIPGSMACTCCMALELVAELAGTSSRMT